MYSEGRKAPEMHAKLPPNSSPVWLLPLRLLGLLRGSAQDSLLSSRGCCLLGHAADRQVTSRSLPDHARGKNCGPLPGRPPAQPAWQKPLGSSVPSSETRPHPCPVLGSGHLGPAGTGLSAGANYTPASSRPALTPQGWGRYGPQQRHTQDALAPQHLIYFGG